ncbi:MAG: LamG domain-containing protein, partial [Bacteroidetes bacterium]|nr:LamG domain-containing protein [Bacteroidota bacterium]
MFLFLVFFIQKKVFAQDDLILSREINAITCNNWLRTLDPGDCIKAGNIKVTGNKVTVEALINRTEPYFGGFKYGGDIVSKHTDPATVNYLLRSNNAEITTSNGYFSTNSICEISLNKTYHVALVYDGTTLKFYRNGFLMSQVPASGNLIQNNFITTIGDWAQYTAPIGTSFKGYINEVRIWNVARTQTELRTYMGTSLPNPTTQTGLLAYYTFENLVNKQGNTLFNGILMQNATINNSNTNCNFIPDSCGCNLNFDFYYDYDPCSPLSVKFHGTGTDISNPKWIFDDGSTITGNLSPVKT